MISVRVSAEQEQRYREFAKSRGITVSEFMRQCADDVIAQAEAILKEAEEERRHAQEVADFKRRFNAFLEELHSTPAKDLTDEELAEMRMARYD